MEISSMPDTGTESHILCERHGRIGMITLNRPKALNALNLDMIRTIAMQLDRWAYDDRIHAFVMRSSSDRAFCAGGDVRAIGILPDPAARVAMGRDFFGEEFVLNQAIARLRKPFISLINGVAMGGGLGLSVHGSHRVVSETVKMAMPENLIGYFPDVGATSFLTQCPRYLGRFLAITGASISTQDALYSGLGTHHVPAAAFAALTEDLVKADRLDHAKIDNIIAGHAARVERSAFEDRLDEIEAVFGKGSFDDMYTALREGAASRDWMKAAVEAIEKSAPTSLLITWKRMVGGEGQVIETILKDDYRVALRMVARPDFAEGIRAVLVDKDHNPHWSPSRLSDVTSAQIDDLLAPLDEVAGLSVQDLDFPEMLVRLHPRVEGYPVHGT